MEGDSLDICILILMETRIGRDKGETGEKRTI